MTNTTDKQILTAAGKALLAQLNAEEKALVIDKMIFANVSNRPVYPQPDDVVPSEHVSHEAAVEQRGRLSVDSVIYSTTLTSQEGPFEFNWTGTYCSEYGVLVTIDHHALTPKTSDEPGVAGNTLVRSVVLEYKDIAAITNITVDASSWQYNATPRMKKMDSDTAQANIDENGKDWFIEDGFQVTPQSTVFSIKAGAGYVSGNRVLLEFARVVQVPNKPSFIYVDAHREGTSVGEQVTLFDFVITAEEKDDYTDANSVKHFVCKIAQVLVDGSVSDLRPISLQDEKSLLHNGEAVQQSTRKAIHPKPLRSIAKVGDVVSDYVDAVRLMNNDRVAIFDINPKRKGKITSINQDAGTITFESESSTLWIGTLNGIVSDIQYSATNVPSVELPAIEQVVTESITPDSSKTSSNIAIKGEKKFKSVIKAHFDKVINIRDGAYLSSFSVLGDGHKNPQGGTGRCISTTDNGVQAYSLFDSLVVSGYRVGAYIRNTVNAAYEKLNWKYNTCHLYFARASYTDDNTNPEPESGWNAADGRGFYQNIIGVRDSNFSFGEVAIFGTALCGVFDNVSTQVQEADPNGNKFLPDGEPGTGIWLQAGKDGDRRGSGANSMRGWYSEGSDRGLYLRDQEYFEMSASFMQGRGTSNRSKFARIINSVCHFKGVILYDWFDETFNITDNSTVFHSDGGLGASGQVLVDQSSKYRPRGEIDRAKFEYEFTHGSQLPNTKYLLSDVLPAYGFGTLRFSVIRDGYVEEHYSCYVDRYTSRATVVTWISSEPIGFNLETDTSGAIKIVIISSQSHVLNILFSIDGGKNVSGNAIRLNPEVI
ncbi:MAG: hypothetical protein ACI935_000052 [Moritella dasanensis]|jgi:hypothetical protein